MTITSRPLYLLGFGQSNIVGGADSGLNPANWDTTEPDPEVTFWNPATATWEVARIDPIFAESTSFGRGTSMAWHVALSLHERTGQPVRIIVEGHGGAPIDGAGPNRSGWIADHVYSDYYRTLADMITNAGVPRIDLAVFAQGEANNDDAEEWRTMYRTGPEYRVALDMLLAQLRAEPWFDATTPFIMPTLAPGGNDDRNDVIGMLHADGDPASDTAYAVEPLRPVPHIGPSGQHWSVAGTPDMALRVVEAWERVLVDLPYDPFAYAPFVAASAGADVHQGYIDYSAAPGGLSVNLLGGRGTGWATGDDLTQVIGLLGSAHNDYLRGNLGFNRIDGGQGNDTILGLGGRDWLRGAAGDDSLLGGNANDILQGGIGDDTLEGGQGFDVLRGDAGDDSLLGGSGADTILGGAGADTLRGQSGNDSLSGGLGDDLIRGGIGRDWLSGDIGDDMLWGEAGFDTLLGGAGNDTVMGNHGNDLIYGQTGNDLLLGGIGADTIHGNDGNDSIRGGSGHDLLFGGDGDDLILGNAGRDTLDGGAGNDWLHGGLGADIFIFGVGSGQDTVMDFSAAEGDILHLDTRLVATPDALSDLVQVKGSDLILTFDADTRLTLWGIADLDSLAGHILFT